jgi:hypothetical protein
MHRLLVIGPDAWKGMLDRLVRYKNDTGMSSALLTQGGIYSRYSPSDEPECVKRAIEEHRRLYGVRYVLLAGDVNQFPVRYIRAINTERGTKWYWKWPQF